LRPTSPRRIIPHPMRCIAGKWAAAAAAMTTALVLATGGAASANETSCATDPPPHPSPRIERIAVEGLNVNVLLPSDYGSSASRRYPVLYLLHALNYNENTWLDLSDIEKFTAGFGGDQAAIVVMPDGGPMGWYTDWPGGKEQWESYHLMHLIPAIDARFRTLADRAHRAVAGFSMGGYGALLYAARRPDLFVAAGGFSPISHITIPDQPYQGAAPDNAKTDAGSPGPAFGGGAHPYRTPDDANSGCNGGSSQWGSGVRDVQWHARNPADLVSNLRGATVYVASGNGVPCGPDDPADRPTFAFEPGDAGTLVMNRDYYAPAARAAGVRVVEDYYGCGVHTMRYAERDLHAFWPLMLGAFGAAPPATFDYRSADADFSVWNWTFHADPARAAEFLEVRGAGRAGLTLTGSGTETVVTPDMFHAGQAVGVEGALPARAVADADGRLTLRVDLGAAHSQDQFSGPGEPSFVTRVVRFKPLGGPATHRAERPWISLPRQRACRSDSVAATLVRRRATGERIVALRAYVHGKRVLSRTGSRVRARVVIAGLGRGRATVRLVGVTSAGRRVAARRVYPRCPAAPRARGDSD
jgi:diacylglycerol O-acyltransferase/trehalose O-mycolyltransferase